MYCDFFGFKELPFAITPNPRFIFLSKHHREAFAHLLYGIDNHAGFIEFTGEVGSGKTTTLRALLSQLDENKYRTAYIFNPSLSSDELLRSINREFGIKITGSIDELMHALNQFLLWENAFGRTIVLVIDEAQNLDPKVLEQIRMISNLETDTDKLIQIVLSGQPELATLLEGNNLRQLSQRITVRFQLAPLDFEDMRAYIDHRLEIAGGWKAVSISPAALKKILRFSNGLPRLINILCDRVLLIAYADETRDISDRMVSKAIRELRRGKSSAKKQLTWKILAVFLLAVSLAGLGYLVGNRTISESQESAQPSNQKPKVSVNNLHASHAALARELGPQSEVASSIIGFNLLAKEWNVRPVTGYRDISVNRGLEVIAARRGLRILQFRGNLDELLQIDSPCILELSLPGVTGNRYLALIEHTNGQFIVGAPQSNYTHLSDSELTGIWTGRAFIPWRNLHKLPDHIELSSNAAQIGMLQQMLVQAGTLSSKPSNAFDHATREAVKNFQVSRHLPADGVPGPHTLILLYRASKSVTEPSLTNRRKKS
jgi:general secretion pathway protein A